MPYIKNYEHRKELDNGRYALEAGELNYQIFSYIKKNSIWIAEKDIRALNNKTYNPLKILNFVQGFLGNSPNYQKYNDMVGALLCCYNELKRRYCLKIEFLKEIIELYNQEIAIYEDTKIIANGDVE